MSRDRQNEYIDIWKNRVKEASGDVIDILLQQNMNRDPAIKKQIEQARQDFQPWLPQPDIQTLEYRLDGKAGENIARTADYRPERDGTPSLEKAIQYADRPVQIVKTNNVLEQIAHIYDPEDQSMGRLYDYLNEHAIEPMKGNPSWERHPAGHPDNSYGQAEKMAGKAVGDYLDNSLGIGQAVNGKDGTRPAGEQNQSYGPMLETGFQNMKNKEIARAIEEYNQAQGYTYDKEHGSREAFSFVKGMKMAPLEAQTAFYSFASLAGELVYSVTGGDPKALRDVQSTLRQYKKELDAMEPMTLDRIIDPEHPERTLQNVTDYLYQNLGNQLNVPFQPSSSVRLRKEFKNRRTFPVAGSGPTNYRYCSSTIFSLSFRKSPKSHLKRTCFLFRLAKSRERVSSLILKGSLPFL